MNLAGTEVAPFEGKDCLKLVPESIVQDKKRTQLQSKDKIAASIGTAITMSCVRALRGDGQGQSGFIILDCYDAAGKIIKAIWKPLAVSSEWKTVKYDILLDEKVIGAPGLTTIGLRLLCHGEGNFYIDDVSVSPKL